MSYDVNNLFAKILRNELDCIKVYEDEHTLAFMDIMPQADGHTLVVPKEPAELLLDLSDQACGYLLIAVKKVAAAVKAAMAAEGVTLLQLNGAAAGQTIPHVHFHILPGSILNAQPHAREPADPDKLEALAKRIRSQL